MPTWVLWTLIGVGLAMLGEITLHMRALVRGINAIDRELRAVKGQVEQANNQFSQNLQDLEVRLSTIARIAESWAHNRLGI